MSDLPNIVVGTADNFAGAALARSAEVPVLVDFWAAWCAPCRALAPTLEALAERHAGALAIVKVDTDAEQSLAAHYAVRSLPTLLLFRDGQPVGQLVGAQPLAALERFIEPHLSRPTDALLADASAARERGDASAAAALLEQALALDPTDYRIHPPLAECYLDLERSADATRVLAELPANVAVSDVVQRIAARLSLVAEGEVVADDPISAAFNTARAAAARGDYEQAVPALLALLPRHRDWQDGSIRRTLVDIFSVLGADARVKAWRTQLARTLN